MIAVQRTTRLLLQLFFKLQDIYSATHLWCSCISQGYPLAKRNKQSTWNFDRKPSQESWCCSSGLSFKWLPASESSHFSKCEYRSLQLFSHKFSLPIALWICVFWPAVPTPAHSASPCAHLPEGWASKTFVIWDNFVLNTSYILFLLLILRGISISAPPYLLPSCFSDWQSCWEPTWWQ